ncbi:Protein CBG26872 [Caenorhabditis briggsae]|uniref:Protein CBG26872 n=1 Tax=Caenorhabditis briggsae TaxID=6238 RepID=B6II72_CAEBR|nr:Protein CBG26872 [Caenorhabditis briggsae]CAR99602.1 Protein CBG26872 [Caenorhabditis briggsae]
MNRRHNLHPFNFPSLLGLEKVCIFKIDLFICIKFRLTGKLQCIDSRIVLLGERCTVRKSRRRGRRHSVNDRIGCEYCHNVAVVSEESFRFFMDQNQHDEICHLSKSESKKLNYVKRDIHYSSHLNNSNDNKAVMNETFCQISRHFRLLRNENSNVLKLLQRLKTKKNIKLRRR